MTRTNDEIVNDIIRCANSWDDEARLLGNVTAGEIKKALKPAREAKIKRLVLAARQLRSDIECELSHWDDCTEEKCVCGVTPFLDALKEWEGEFE